MFKIFKRTKKLQKTIYIKNKLMNIIIKSEIKLDVSPLLLKRIEDNEEELTEFVLRNCFRNNYHEVLDASIRTGYDAFLREKENETI